MSDLSTAFERWWHQEGSKAPTRAERADLEEFIKERCRIAWENGAYLAKDPHGLDPQQVCRFCDWIFSEAREPQACPNCHGEGINTPNNQPPTPTPTKKHKKP